MCTMTRTWLECALQQDDSDLLSYDFADGCPFWKAWWFRIAVAAISISLIWLFWPA
jgi:hypothetical protein